MEPGSSTASPNLFNLLNLPAATSFGNVALDGILDFGTLSRDDDRAQRFPWPRRVEPGCGAEQDIPDNRTLRPRIPGGRIYIFNHANMYVVAANADAGNFSGGPIIIQGKKGGLGVGDEEGVQHDERRFGQFALRLHF